MKSNKLPATSLAMHSCKLLSSLYPAAQVKFHEDLLTHDEVQAPHTCREISLGYYLQEINSLKIEMGNVDGKTPEWVVLRPDGTCQAIFEQFTLHQKNEVEIEMDKALKNHEIYCEWIDEDNTSRLSKKIINKVKKYTPMALRHQAGLVTSVFDDFRAATDHEELMRALYGENDGGVFRKYFSLSGVIFSREWGGRYIYNYMPNPNADHPVQLVSAII